MKKFIVARFMTRLPLMIHQFLGYCWVITMKGIIHISFLWIHFYRSRLECFFSGEKLASYSYVLIYLIFVHYLVSYSAYIFLYFFLSNFKLFDSLLRKGRWYISSVTIVISLEMYLATHTYNLVHNILELYNVSIQTWLTTSKTKRDI